MNDAFLPFFESPQFKRCIQLLSRKDKVKISGLFGSSKAVFLHLLKELFPLTLIVFDEEAQSLFEELHPLSENTFLLSDEASFQYKVLNVLLQQPILLVAKEEQKVLKKDVALAGCAKLSVGMQMSPEELVKMLLSFGYREMKMAQEDGDFARRGCIVDIVQERGWRVEFGFEGIESIREFETSTQLSLLKKRECTIYSKKDAEKTASLFDYLNEGILFGENECRRECLLQVLHSLVKEGVDIEFCTRPAPYFAQRVEQLLDFLKSTKENVVIATAQKKRVLSMIKDVKNVKVIDAPFKRGFQTPSLTLLTDTEIFGHTFIEWKKRFAKKAEDLFDLLQLQEGDYLVHAKYGIGRYKGLKQMEVDGCCREYLVVEYKDGDILYVPIQELHMVQKYIADRKRPPALSKLGSKAWVNAKRAVREDIMKVAEQLLRTQAIREARRGYACAPDTLWQHDFEAQFPFIETPDQAKTVEQVKKDLESSVPMDRVVCGDVGFGKTEIAARAAFKVCCEGRQVALLAPTTVLAQQHYYTFCARFSSYPVNVKMLSRFQSKKEQEEVLKQVSEGRVDILIGTHRILSEDVRFKCLGLLIVDEEHRFGVKQKEKIKSMYPLVDVLTLTATPIPRTLYMIVGRLRDVSMMHTPIPGRQSVETFVKEFDLQLIKRAVEKELERGGQVFFVNDKISGLESLKRMLEKLLPHIRVRVAHGRMSEKELSSVMIDFLNQKFDVLLCTTIIEAGLDMPNVNTLIVNNAQNFGLAQLHQIRGRVGRGERKAYAYFLYPSRWVLTRPSAQRLYTIKMLKEPGSGYKIALKDLQIRGAGNILGVQQHGNIATVGLELYCKLLQEAVAKLRGESVKEEFLPKVELPFDAFIPKTYIPDDGERFLFYKKLCKAATTEELDAIREEFLDRFGPAPEQVKNLLELFYIRCLCKDASVLSISYKDGDKLLLRFLKEVLHLPKNLMQKLCLFPDKRGAIFHSFSKEELREFLKSMKEA